METLIGTFACFAVENNGLWKYEIKRPSNNSMTEEDFDTDNQSTIVVEQNDGYKTSEKALEQARVNLKDNLEKLPSSFSNKAFSITELAIHSSNLMGEGSDLAFRYGEELSDRVLKLKVEVCERLSAVASDQLIENFEHYLFDGGFAGLVFNSLTGSYSYIEESLAGNDEELMAAVKRELDIVYESVGMSPNDLPIPTGGFWSETGAVINKIFEAFLREEIFVGFLRDFDSDSTEETALNIYTEDTKPFAFDALAHDLTSMKDNIIVLLVDRPSGRNRSTYATHFVIGSDGRIIIPQKNYAKIDFSTITIPGIDRVVHVVASQYLARFDVLLDEDDEKDEIDDYLDREYDDNKRTIH